MTRKTIIQLVLSAAVSLSGFLSVSFLLHWWDLRHPVFHDLQSVSPRLLPASPIDLLLAASVGILLGGATWRLATQRATR